MNTTIAIGILAFWAVLATGVMIAALRSRAQYRDRLTLVRRDRDKAISIAEGFKTENQRLLKKAFPARDSSDGKLSMARALRTITGPVKPTSARTSSTSRNDSPDIMSGLAMGSLIAPGGWSAPATDTSSCDTSSSSSSDGGSCGGGE